MSGRDLFATAHVLGDVRQGLLRHIEGWIQLPHQALADGNGEEGGGHVTFQQHPVAPRQRSNPLSLFFVAMILKKKWCFLMRKTMANDWLKKNMATSDDRLLILSRGVPVWIMSDPTLGNLIFKSRPIQSGATEALKTLAPNITPHVI